VLETLPLSHLALSLTAGSLTTLSPCVFPILPLVVGGALQANRFAPLAMGAGMAGSFALLGVFLGALAPALGIEPEHVRVFGAWLLIAFAAVMLVPALDARFSRWVMPIASSANAASARLDAGSLGGAFGLGALLGLVWSPCSGPLLGSALTLVAAEGGAAKGAVILGLFGLGAAVPLVAVAYASRSGFNSARGWVMAHIKALKTGFGVLLAVVGVLILSGGDKWIEARVVEILPEAWVGLTTRL
jgi:cytochrome c biogenesis protein CcdA